MESAIAIPERHLGLQGAAERPADSEEAMIDALASLAEQHLDLDGLLGLECGLFSVETEPCANSLLLFWNLFVSVCLPIMRSRFTTKTIWICCESRARRSFDSARSTMLLFRPDSMRCISGVDIRSCTQVN